MLLLNQPATRTGRTAMDVEGIFKGLESNQTLESEDAKRKLLDVISQTKADWLVQGMMEYFLKTGSLRIVEVLVKVQTPYDTYIFDKLAEWLKSSAHRVSALNLFFFVVRRHPTWLYKVEKHRLIKEIFKLLLTEKEIVPLMSSLICIITLLPIIPNSVPNLLVDLFEVFGHLATWNCQNPNRLPDEKLVHLQLGVQMLFHRLYGMYPCNFLAYLSEFCKKEKAPIFHHTIKPLLETVRVHPLLVTATTESEISNVRWKEMEPHDVVMECVRLALPVTKQDINWDSTLTYNLTATVSKSSRGHCGGLRNHLMASHGSMSSTTTTTSTHNFFGGSGGLSRSSSKGRCHTPLSYREVPHFDGGGGNSNSGSTIWSPYNEIAGQMPLTPTPSCMLQGVASVNPQYLSVTGSSPPEAAVEATPETTPLKEIKEMRHSVIAAASNSGQIANRNAVRAIFPSQPSSPMRKDYATFNFPDVAGGPPHTKVVATLAGGEEGSMYERRIRKLLEDRMHSQSPFQTIEMQGIQKGIRSPVDSSSARSSCTIEGDDSGPVRSHLIHPTSVRATPPQPATHTPVPLESITKICVDCNETDMRMCSSGGVQIPSTRSVQWLAKGLKRRSRMTSYCYADSSCERVAATLASACAADGAVKVRRTKSCSSIFTSSKSGSEDDMDGGGGASTHKHAGRLQKSGKMLAIAKQAAASNAHALGGKFACRHVATQTIDVWHNSYEESLFELLAQTNDMRNLLPPHEILDQFVVSSLYTKEHAADAGWRVDQEQFQLMCLQLQYERYRREIHAERNRRLMGRSRDKRSLEMERDRLREQLNCFAGKNEELMSQIDATIKSSNEREKIYLDELTALKTNYHREIEANRSLQQANENLQTRLNEELASRREMNYELEALRGDLFNMRSELENAQAQAEVGMQCKQELARLEAEFIVMGEIQVRCRDRLAEIDNFRARDQELHILQETYNMELKELKHSLEEKSSYVDSVKHKIQELQAQLINSEKVITEQKRLIKTIKDEYEEKLKSVNKKYDVQKSIISQMEEKIVMHLHKPSSSLAAACSPDTDKTDVASSMDRNSPLSTSLQSSESLSASLRSDEMRNLQTVVEKAESGAISVMNAARGRNIIEGTRLPALDMASSASTATMGLSIASPASPAGSAIVSSPNQMPVGGGSSAQRKTYDMNLSTLGHTHPHLHLQLQHQQQQQQHPQQPQQPQQSVSQQSQPSTATTSATTSATTTKNNNE